MAQFVNQYSLLLFAVPLVLILLFLLLRSPGSRLKQLLALLLFAGAVAGFILLRPGGHAASAKEFEDLLPAAGRPTLLEIYSSY